MRFGPAVSRVGVICSQQIDWFLGLRTRSGNALSLPLSSSLEMEEGELGSWRAPT